MKVLVVGHRWKAFSVLAGAVVLVAVTVAVMGTMPKTHAIITGDPGAPPSSGSSAGYHTTNGHGWKVYTVGSGTGPVAFQDGSTWSSVSAKCGAAGANKVWVYVIRNGSGAEKGYTFTNTYEYYRSEFNPKNNTGGANHYPSKPWWVDRPGAGGDPYVYNSSGVYDGVKRYGGASGYGDADSVVSSIRAIYQKEGGDWNKWGWSIGWFCWQDANFKLIPSVAITPTIGDAGTEIRFNPIKVDNQGTTPSTKAQWVVTTFTLTPGEAIPGGGIDTRAPAVFYGHGAATSPALSGTDIFPKGNKSNWLGPQYAPDLSVGDRFCFTLSVQPYMHNNSRWNHSAPACFLIAKKPKAQILGGDLFVGRGSSYNTPRVSTVNTSVTRKSGTAYGSWAEYAIASSGGITGMASGSGYAGGTSVANLCGVSLLTFTSGLSSGSGCNEASMGRYIHATAMPNVAAKFPIRVAASEAAPGRPADPAVLPSTSIDIVAQNLSGVYQAPAGVNSLTMTGGASIPKGRWVVINAPGATIKIAKNLTYTSTDMESLADIPQVIIIAKNIIIADEVQQVDAWLLAVGSGSDGRINTCGTGAGITERSPLTHEQCNVKLTIYGPIMANNLILRRTAGSGKGSASGRPAEVFDLRADAYLWATYQGLGEGGLPTVSTKELPPRY